MFDMKKVEIEWGGKTLTLETGRVARQADGAVLATLGETAGPCAGTAAKQAQPGARAPAPPPRAPRPLRETVVLCAVTAAKNVKPGQDFFPLTVHYQEKFSAAGRIPGGFFKRERGATEKETLTSRLIDRPIRPLFPEGFYNEVPGLAHGLPSRAAADVPRRPLRRSPRGGARPLQRRRERARHPRKDCRVGSPHHLRRSLH